MGAAGDSVDCSHCDSEDLQPPSLPNHATVQPGGPEEARGGLLPSVWQTTTLQQNTQRLKAVLLKTVCCLVFHFTVLFVVQREGC